MFKELAPLVRHRAVLFTLSHVEDDHFRVNVIPKKITDGENEALTTPVSVTGTAEDLDRELPQTLLQFVSSHLELKNSLERAKAEMEEASKAARAEARKKSANQATKRDPAGSSSKPAMAAEPSAPARAETPKAASLFDSGPETHASCVADAWDSGDTRSSRGEPQIEKDEEILRETCSAEEDDEGGEAA